MSATRVVDNGAAERLAEDIEKLADEAEKLAPEPGADGKRSAALERLAKHARAAKEQFDDLQDRARYRARQAAEATDEAVHDHPYTAMGVAAAVGLLIGVLIARR